MGNLISGNIKVNSEKEEIKTNQKEENKLKKEDVNNSLLLNSATEESAQLFNSFPKLIISCICDYLYLRDLKSFIFTSKKIKEKLYQFPPQ